MSGSKKESPHKKLNRRKFMSAGALGSAALLAGCDCAERCNGAIDANDLSGSVASRELTMVSTWPRGLPGLGDAAENYARYITEMSGGKIRVHHYAANELVPALESFDAVSGGNAHIYHAAEYYWTSKSPAYPFFTAVPFGMTLTEIMGWIEFGGGQQLWDELAAQFNIKPFMAGNTGHQMGGWYRHEIKSLDDLRGLKIRMPGIGGEVMNRAGASAVTIAGSEIYQALQSGTIDATEWVGPWNDVALGFHREAKYYYWPGFHEPSAALSVGVNLEFWQSLNLQEKSIFENAARAVNSQMTAQYAHFNAISLKTLTEKYGVELRHMPQDVLAALAQATKEVLTDISQKDELTGRVYDSYRRELQAGIAWNAISDEAYMTARRELFT
ncbi:MAG: TRAP transporter substrate-binding protein [bacterium]